MTARLVSPAAAHVPLLIDRSITVLRLVTALASAGLTIRQDLQRNALAVIPIHRPQEGMHN